MLWRLRKRKEICICTDSSNSFEFVVDSVKQIGFLCLPVFLLFDRQLYSRTNIYVKYMSKL